MGFNNESVGSQDAPHLFTEASSSGATRCVWCEATWERMLVHSSTVEYSHLSGSETDEGGGGTTSLGIFGPSAFFLLEHRLSYIFLVSKASSV